MNNKNSDDRIDLNVGIKKISAAASQYFKNVSTKEIVGFLSRTKFPDLSDFADTSFNRDNYAVSYDLTMGCLALEQREDKDEVIKSEGVQIKAQRQKAKEFCEEAIANHNEKANSTHKKGDHGNPYFFITDTQAKQGDLLKRMLLTSAAPEFYSAKAAPKEFMQAARIMAKTWGNLLRKAKPNAPSVLVPPKSYETKNLASEDETIDLLPTMDKKDLVYTDDQIKEFERCVVHHLVMTGKKSIRMNYDMDTTLSFASEKADIAGAGLFFRSHMNTRYDESSRNGPEVCIDGKGLESNITIQVLGPKARKTLHSYRKSNQLNM